MRQIGRQEVKALVEQGVPLVEVLPRSEYDREHLAGAVSIPLAALDDEAPSRLGRHAAVVVYCHDHQ